MRRLGIIWLCAVFPVGTVIAAEDNPDSWKTYRSEKFGYELSYPAGMEFVADFDGGSGKLTDADNDGFQVWFEVWPPSECSVSLEERTKTTAREVGIQRAKVLTQADGPVGSSYCGDPLTVREFDSLHGARIFELELSCVNEEYPFSDDFETDMEQNPATVDVGPVITFVGIKGPTYFVDISQPWLKRILIADPVDVDPRRNADRNPAVSDDIRQILKTVKTFQVPKPPGICIQDLR
jgi:hypothetical protein